jgi:chromosomal replication initiator protein
MIWVVKKLTMLSYPQIGRHFGGRDHSTALNAISRIDALITANDPSVADLKGWVSE